MAALSAAAVGLIILGLGAFIIMMLIAFGVVSVQIIKESHVETKKETNHDR